MENSSNQTDERLSDVWKVKIFPLQKNKNVDLDTMSGKSAWITLALGNEIYVKWASDNDGPPEELSYFSKRSRIVLDQLKSTVTTKEVDEYFTIHSSGVKHAIIFPRPDYIGLKYFGQPVLVFDNEESRDCFLFHLKNRIMPWKELSRRCTEWANGNNSGSVRNRLYSAIIIDGKHQWLYAEKRENRNSLDRSVVFREVQEVYLSIEFYLKIFSAIAVIVSGFRPKFTYALTGIGVYIIINLFGQFLLNLIYILEAFKSFPSICYELGEKHRKASEYLFARLLSDTNASQLFIYNLFQVREECISCLRDAERFLDYPFAFKTICQIRSGEKDYYRVTNKVENIRNKFVYADIIGSLLSKYDGKNDLQEVLTCRQ